ncbi:FAD-binding protein [Roseateles sp. GG27B]
MAIVGGGLAGLSAAIELASGAIACCWRRAKSAAGPQGATAGRRFTAWPAINPPSRHSWAWPKRNGSGR